MYPSAFRFRAVVAPAPVYYPAAGLLPAAPRLLRAAAVYAPPVYYAPRPVFVATGIGTTAIVAIRGHWR